MMEQFLYKLMPMRADILADGLTDRENEVIESHAAYLSGLKEKGLVVANDPAVKEGVLDARLFPFRIALMGE